MRTCWRQIATLGLVLLLVLAFTIFRGGYYISAEHDGRLLFAWAISEGERFQIEFVHSLNLSPIVDVFEWIGPGEGLILRESKFLTLGAGTPTPADFLGSELLHESDGFRLVGIDVPMGDFAILTHYIPNHRVVFGGNEAFLVELAGSGESVTIGVRRMSRFSQIGR